MSIDLICAARDRNLQKIKACLAAGENINFRDPNGRTAVIWAASYGFLEIVEFLVNQGANIVERSKQNETPFLAAVIYGKLNVIQFFIQSRKLTASELIEGLFLSVKVGNLEVVQYLHGLQINYGDKKEEDRNLFLTAVYYGYIDIVRLLYFFNPEAAMKSKDSQGNSALHLAILRSQAEIVHFLLEQAQYSDVIFTQRNNDNLDGFGLAVQQNQLAMARTFLQKGAYIDLTAFSEKIPETEVRQLYNAAAKLFTAIEADNLEEFLSFLKLLESGINGRHFVDGNTVLHIALLRNNISVITPLIYNGANFNIRNKQGVTPYQMAINHNDLFIQAIGHFFKTLLLLKTKIPPASYKPLQSAPQDTKENSDRKNVAEKVGISKTTLPENRGVSTSTKMISPEELAIEIDAALKNTIQKLMHLEQEHAFNNIEIRRCMSYMYFHLGSALCDKKPKQALKFLQNVRQSSGNYYFQEAHYKMYYLVKQDKVNLQAPAGEDANRYKYYLLIGELLYAQKEQDDEGVTIHQHIAEYTQEDANNLQKLKAVPDILRQDSIAIKKDFLAFLKLLREKNNQYQLLLAENARLKEALQARHAPVPLEPLFTRPTSPLPPIPEVGKLIISDYYTAGSDQHSAYSVSAQPSPKRLVPGTPIRIASPELESTENNPVSPPKHTGIPTAAFQGVVIYSDKRREKTKTKATTQETASLQTGSSSQPSLQRQSPSPSKELNPHSNSMTSIPSSPPIKKLSPSKSQESNQKHRRTHTSPAPSLLMQMSSESTSSLRKELLSKSQDDLPDAAPIEGVMSLHYTLTSNV